MATPAVQTGQFSVLLAVRSTPAHPEPGMHCLPCPRSSGQQGALSAWAPRAPLANAVRQERRARFLTALITAFLYIA